MEKQKIIDIKNKRSPEVDESDFSHALSILTLIRISQELQAEGIKVDKYKQMEYRETSHFLNKISEGILPNEAIDLLDKKIVFSQEDTPEDLYYYNPDEQSEGWRE